MGKGRKRGATLLLDEGTRLANDEAQPLLQHAGGEERLDRLRLEVGKLLDRDKKELLASLRDRPVRLEPQDDDRDTVLLRPRTDAELRQLADERIRGFLSSAGDKGSDKIASGVQTAVRRALEASGEAADIGWIPGMVVSVADAQASALRIGAIAERIRETDPYYRLDDNDRGDDAGSRHLDAKSLKATLTLVALRMETKAAASVSAQGASIGTKAAAAATLAAVGGLAFVGPVVAPLLVAGVATGSAIGVKKAVDKVINKLSDAIRGVDCDVMAQDLARFAAHEATRQQAYDAKPAEERDPLQQPPQFCRSALTHLIPPIAFDHWDDEVFADRGVLYIRSKLD